ncbi:hypothetical protein DWV53_14910, partial [Segatella copri]
VLRAHHDNLFPAWRHLPVSVCVRLYPLSGDTILIVIVHILNILAVAIQLNDHAKKAESPMLLYQAHELDYKSPHNSKFIIVSN